MNKPTLTPKIESLILTYRLLRCHGCTHRQALRILYYCLQVWCPTKEAK